jgi:hypothetical protein
MGLQGPPGLRGPSGRDGIDGKDGLPGAPGRDGKDGANGPAGRDGAIGPQGLSGKDGRDGKDGRNGIDGKDGKDGRNGIDGRDGAIGSQGLPGKDGIDGKHGRDGIDGAPGPAGRDGKDGVDGKHGRDGKDGVDGKHGRDGKDGVDSLLRNFAKSIYVDLCGKDETAEPYSLSKPFASLEAAEKTSKEGDTIFVGAGSYEVTTLTLPQRNWVLSHGTRLIKKDRGYLIRVTGDFSMKGNGIIDTKGSGLLFIENRNLSQVTLDGLEIENSTTDDFEPCFVIEGGYLVNLHLVQANTAKQPLLAIAGSDFAQPKLTLTARKVSAGGNKTCLSLSQKCSSKVSIDSLIVSNSAICVSGGEHTIHTGEVSGAVSLNAGQGSFIFDSMVGSLVFNRSDFRVTGAVLSADCPLTFAGMVNARLKIDKINFGSVGALLTLESNSQLSLDCLEFRGENGEAFSMQTPLAYETGYYPDIHLNLRTVVAQSLFSLASHLSSTIRCQIQRARFQRRVVSMGQLEANCSVNLFCEDGSVPQVLLVSEDVEPTSPPHIVLSGSWTTTVNENQFQTKYPLAFTNFEMNGVKKT